MVVRLLLGAAAAVGIILAVMLVRTLSLPSPASVEPSPIPVSSEAAAASAEKLAQAIRIKTVSFGVRTGSPGAIKDFHAYLEAAFPAVHAALERTILPEGAVIFRWPGQDASARPVGLAAHIDVVPVERNTETAWANPPFAGVIEAGFVWGRGALDDKSALIAIMEAAEQLAEEGFAPARDTYFLFGHDEEVGGLYGAGAIVNHLKEKGVSLAWTLDEGLAPVKGLVPGYDGVVGLIALSEKGYVDLEITTDVPGGHSSTPPADSAASIVARAVARLNDNPYTLEIDGVSQAFMTTIAPYLPFAQRFAIANLWATRGFVATAFGENPALAASLRTTTAVTVINAGQKANVLPQKAKAIVNYRIHPRDSVDGVVQRAQKIIDDPRVTVRPLQAWEPSEISAVDGPGYAVIADTIRAVHGEIIVAPYITLGGTDQRHYAKIADDAYRFAPFIFETDDLPRIHGTDERINIENFARGIEFYKRLLAAGAG